MTVKVLAYVIKQGKGNKQWTDWEEIIHSLVKGDIIIYVANISVPVKMLVYFQITIIPGT